MNLIKASELLLIFAVLCGANHQINEIPNDHLRNDTNIIDVIKKGIRREILLPLIEGLKTALDCDCGSEEACPCLSGYKSDICVTEGCVKAGADLLTYIDNSYDPCDDFYMFSCGRWIEKHSELRNSISVLSAIEAQLALRKMVRNELEMEQENQPKSVQKFMKAYRECLDYDGFQFGHEWTLRRILKDLGGMPMMEKNWNDNDYEWTDAYSKAFYMFKIRSPLSFTVEPNPYNTSENVLHLTEPLSNYLRKLDYESIKEFAMRLGENTNATISKDIEDLKMMEEFIYNNVMAAHILSTVPEEYKMTTVEELNRLYPSVEWLPFLQNVFGNYFEGIDYTITEREKVFVEGMSYIPNILEAIKKEQITKRFLANYITASFINDVFTVYKMRKIPPADQEKKCFQYFFRNLPFVVDHINGKRRKEKYLDDSMIKYGFKAMRKLVSQADWLDSETRKAVQVKLDAMKYYAHFPPFTQDARTLDKYYEKLPEMSNNTLDNHIFINRFVVQHILQRINVVNNRSEWYPVEEIAGSTANAVQFREQNSVYIPAGFQTYPYFVSGRPNFVNFGTMGLVLGHEITHGFNETGSQKDKTGSLRDWWTVKAKNEFYEKAQCFIDQYNSYKYGGNTNNHVNGITTLSENIADNGGIRQSFLAYQLWEQDHGKEKTLPGLQNYTPYQLFFISFATAWCSSLNPEEEYRQHGEDEHSPDKFRIIGTLSNMKEFAETFNCKVGSKMNPKNKCVIW